MPDKQVRELHRLASLYGIETTYEDVSGEDRQAGPEPLLLTIQALGAPVHRLADVAAALREYRLKQWQRCLEPVTVAWDGNAVQMELRLPAGLNDGMAGCRLELEHGRVWHWQINLARLPVLQAVTVEGVDFLSRQFTLPAKLPRGYHKLHLDLAGHSFSTLIMCAPRRAYTPPGENTVTDWGVFLPLYALQSGRSWGAGDLTDLLALHNWTRELGGVVVGTLPLLATYLDQPFEPSPYSPVSRLFWNEFYLDVTRAPELEGCKKALVLLNSPAFQQELDHLRNTPLVDYRRGMAAKRQILEQLAGHCHNEAGGRQESLQRWVASNPPVLDYARFRAAVEKQRAGWTAWSGLMRDGLLREGDYSPEAVQYHLYVQWLAHEQLQILSARGQTRHGPGLYLDLPLGVHGDGYDVWRERDAFALEASSGAPPDMFFSQGQNWLFPPLHPERIREQGYRYYIDCLRHHLKYAGTLRIDHFMGLHRLFWIPGQLTARDGIYVRYRAEEFYAVLTLESHRNHAVIVGEDLGTVPGYVRMAMDRHGIRRMYIMPGEVTPGSKGLNQVPSRVLAGLNTHDMPTFASYWTGLDPGKQAALTGFLQQQGFLEAGRSDFEAVLMACLTLLASSQAGLHLVNLEDLWFEMAPQNIPGTTVEHPNWRRKARYSLEEFSRMPVVLDSLRRINLHRQSAAGPENSQLAVEPARPS